MVAERQSLAMSLRAGMPVQVVNRFTGSWTGGFKVVNLNACGCRVRRVSDRAVIPVDFDLREVRPAHG